MPIFKKTLVEAVRFDRFTPKFEGVVAELESPAVTVKISVTTDEDSIFLKVVNKETDLTVLDVEIPFNIITQHASFGDQTLWAITDILIDKKCAPGSPVEETYVLTEQDIINVATSTLISKDRIFKPEYNNHYSPIRIFVPSKTSTVEDLTIIFLGQYPLQEGVIHPSTVEHNPATQEILQTWKDLLATITITGPTTVNPDEVVDLNVACSDTSVTEIFVEPVIGAVNKTRVLLNNGQGILKVNTFGLDSGDEINIKFGYKYFTGISRYTKTVS